MVKASTNSAMDLSDMADRVNAAAQARRLEAINDPDNAVYVVDRGLKRRNHPEIIKLDTVAVMAEEATKKRRDDHKAKEEPEDEFPLLRHFAYGVIFTMLILWIVEMIVWAVG